MGRVEQLKGQYNEGLEKVLKGFDWYDNPNVSKEAKLEAAGRFAALVDRVGGILERLGTLGVKVTQEEIQNGFEGSATDGHTD